MRRAALLVVVLVLAAGCNSFLAEETDDERGPGGTLTPAPVPTETATAAPPPRVAPGVATTGIADVDRLVASHVRAARNESWVWTESYDITRIYGSMTMNTSINQTARFVDATTYRRDADPLGVRVGRDFLFVSDYGEYANGTEGYEKWFSPNLNRVVYQRRSDPAANRSFGGFATDPIETYLSLDEATVSRIDVGERQHYLIVGSKATVPGYESVDTYEARAVVREDGFVRSLIVTYTVDRPDLYVDAAYSFEYSRFGNVTVERPDWADVARNRTSG